MKKIKIIVIGFTITIAFSISLFSKAQYSNRNNLFIGWAMEDTTPDSQVSLQGQYYERISEYVQSPLKATALAIESVNENKEQVIMIALDLVYCEDGLQDLLRRMLTGKIPDFELNKIFLNLTHTHSSFDASLTGK